MNKKVINFEDLTVGSYIKKRLTKSMEMLCIDELRAATAKVRVWVSNKPFNASFTLKKKDVDEGDYVFVLKVKQENLFKEASL